MISVPYEKQKIKLTRRVSGGGTPIPVPVPKDIYILLTNYEEIILDSSDEWVVAE